MALIQKSVPIVSNNLHGLNPSISSHLIQVREAGNSTFERSRDPRLANTNYEVSSSIDPVNVKPIQPILNGGILDSRKTKVVEEALVDGHSLKRQRGLSYGGQVKPGRGGGLEENILDMKLDGNININISTALRSGMGPGSSNMGGDMLPNLGNIASLLDLIKDIVTNPNMIIQLIQTLQQGLEALQRHVNPLPQNISSSSSTCTMMPLNTGAPLSMSSMKEDVGKPRTKPRDPRQILHTNLIPTNDVSSTPQPKSNGTDPSTIHFSTITSSSQELNMSVNPTSSLPLSTNLPDKERARMIVEQNKMFSAQKLSLVLDLDHTLLNSAKFIEVDRVHDEILKKKEEQDRLKPRRHLFRFPHMGMWTKLRPGIWNFLERASKLYELHICTMGNKVYATEMARVLDPSGSLFAGRVISKGDDGDPFDRDKRLQKSKDLDGVLGMESTVHNLIVVDRYTYFPCSRCQFGLHGPSLLVDVKEILAWEQAKILKGCKVVFSRIFHVGFTNHHLHPLWQTAEKFGAICSNQIDDEVTHVVAISLGTDKVNWVMSTGRYVVHPGWLEASTLLYRRANERDFPIMPPPPSS
ncbi:hypothetical protein AMTRI_Chr11g153660 [Amborella trichopoda]